MTLAIESPTFAPRPKRWTKAEYNQLVERGALQGQRVYLYRGELIEMPPIGALHATAISNVTEWLVRTFTPEFRIRIQSPFETPGESMPEPDGLVVTQQASKRRPHPNEAVLLIEVSDSSLEIDHEKAFEYAAANVADYWILNVRDRELEIYRDPVAEAKSPTGFRYASHERHPANAAVTALARPDALVSVESLLRL